MSINPVFVVYGFVVARAVYDRYGARIAGEFDVLERRLRRASRRLVASARPRRPIDSVERALADLGNVNAALATLAESCGLAPRPGTRWRVSLRYADAASALTSWAPAWARALGAECGIDFEVVSTTSTSSARGRRSGGWRRAAYGYVAAEDARSRDDDDEEEDGEIRRDDGATAARSRDDGDGCDSDDDSDDGFEMVHVVRRATFEQFYSHLKPAIQQLAVDFDAERRASDAGASSSAATANAPEELSECSICMDNKLQVVVDCGHAFCEECHVRWLRVSMTCPVCRRPLPRETRDESDASFALVDYEDVRDVCPRPETRDLTAIASEWRDECTAAEAADVSSRARRVVDRILALPPADERGAGAFALASRFKR